MKKGIFLLAGICMMTACHESLEDRAAREAKEYTEKNCPSPIKQNTRTDSLTFDKETRTIGYWYTLCRETDNAERLKKQETKFRQVLLDGVKASTELKSYKEAGFNVRYVYHSEKNPDKVLLDFTFTEKDY